MFFYGTLMTAFRRPGRSRVDATLTPQGRAWISAALFNLGIYPAAIPSTDSRVWGEVRRRRDVEDVLAALDEIEGYRPAEPDASLYTRVETPMTFWRASGPGGPRPAIVHLRAPKLDSRRQVSGSQGFEDGRVAGAWAYFYNALLGGAQRIESGDYLGHLKVRRR